MELLADPNTISEPEQESSPPDGFYATAYKEAIMSSQSTSAVTYRPVPGFPGYRVGDDGSVWSLYVRRGAAAIISESMTKKSLDKSRRGIVRVTLFNGGKSKSFSIGSLVLTAFVGPRPQGLQVCHYDDNRENNALSNLRWGTQQSNAEDAKRNQRTSKGKSPISVSKVARDEITALASNLTVAQISSRFGITMDAVRRIIHDKPLAYVKKKL